MTVVLESCVRHKLPSYVQVVGILLVFVGIRLKVYVENRPLLKLKQSGHERNP